MEFQNKELKKRTRCIKVFLIQKFMPMVAAAILGVTDKKRLADSKACVKG